MKRSKIVLSLIISLFSIFLLTVCVYASVNVNFQFNSSIKFNPEGVFVELSGQISRGESLENLQPIYNDLKNYTLKPVRNFIIEDGEKSGNYNLDAWESDTVPFLTFEKYVEYSLYIKNFSDEPICVMSSGVPVLSYVNVTENSSDVLKIEPNATEKYSIIFQCLSTTSFDPISFNLTFTIRLLSEVESEQSTFVNFVNNGSNLESIEVDNTLKTLIIPDVINGTKVTTFNDGELISNSSNQIERIIICSDIIEIGDYNFQNLSNLKDIYLPKNLKILGSGCFSNCGALVNIQIPDSVTRIEDNVFDNTGLTSLYLSKNVAYVGANSIMNLTYLYLYDLNWENIVLNNGCFYSWGVLEIYISNNSSLSLIKSKLNFNVLSYQFVDLKDENNNILATFDGFSWL